MTMFPAIYPPPPPALPTMPCAPPEGCEESGEWPLDGVLASGMNAIIPPGTTIQMLQSWETEVAERVPADPWADSYALDAEAE